VTQNRAVLRFNIHYAIQAFAESAGGVFVFVYFLRAGFSVAATLVILAVLVGGRFVLRPIILPFARRFGLKASLMLGALLNGVTFPLLALVHGLGAPLALFCAIGSLAGVFYWTCFHAYFAVMGDAEARGRQVGVREAIATAIGVAAPLIGGYALTILGPGPTFWAVGAIQALSIVPLIGAPDAPVVETSPAAFAGGREVALLMVTDGVFSAGFFYVWQIALFVSLGQSFAAFGGAVAAATLAGAALGPLLGRFVDLGHGRKVVIAAYASAAAIVALRAASLGSPWLAVGANAAGAFVTALLIPAIFTPIYNLAQASPCALRFHIVTEGAWDIGCGGGCLIAAGFAALGLPLSAGILVAVGAAFALMAQLLRFYRTHPAPAAAAV
jgi:hypothetical protein